MAAVEGGSFGAGITGEATKAKLLPLEAAVVESASLEAAAVKTLPWISMLRSLHTGLRRPLPKMPSAWRLML